MSTMSYRRSAESRQPMKKGFTLLEVLLAVVILAGGIIAIMQAFSAGMFASMEAENVELAFGVAQSKLERIYETSGGIADEPRHSVTNDGFAGGVYSNQNFQVQVATDNNNPERVDVTVYWSTKGGDASIALTTLVMN